VELCGLAGIRLQQAAKKLLTFDLTDRAINDGGDVRLASQDFLRQTIPDALVRPPLVEEPLIGPHHPSKALQAEQDKMVQTLLPEASDPPFRVGMK